MYKTCIDWLINSTHLCTSVEFLLDVHPVSSVLGLLNLNMILIFSSLIPNACMQHAWTIFCIAVQVNTDIFCVLDADAERSATWWAGPLPVLLLTTINQCRATKLNIESLPRLNAEVSPTLNDSGECWGCNKSVPSQYSRENIYLVNFPLLHRGSSGRTPTINCGVHVTTQSMCWCLCSDTTNYIMLDILGLTTRIRIFGIQIHLQNMIRSTTTNKVTC